MSLTMYVDGPRWRGHLDRLAEAAPGLVPVVKGNGYGLGLPRLVTESARLGVDTVAVGTYPEARRLLDAPAEEVGGFTGSVMVLTPWRPFEQAVVYDDRVVHTVGRTEDLEQLLGRVGGAFGDESSGAGAPRIVLERLTSMLRHGFSAADLRRAAATAFASGGRVRVEGVALHLPLNQGSHVEQVERLMVDVVAAGPASDTVFVSHLTTREQKRLAAAYPDFTIRPRMGTSLWLGDRDALRVRATVLDVHPVERGEVFGYRGRGAPRGGHLLVVSGGTAHGIGLEAPTGGATLRSRASRVVAGGLDAAGHVRSPFTVSGRPRLFAEPPHMQASMLLLPAGASVPAVGDEVDVRVRFTATDVDTVEIS